MRLVDADALRAKFPEPREEDGGWLNREKVLVHLTGIWAEIDNAPTVCCGTCKHYMPLNKSGLGLCSWGDIDVYGDWICQDWNVEE